MLNFLKRNFKQSPADLKETLYLTNVRSILEYGCATWDPETKTLISELERIQKRAARFVSANYDFTKSSSQMCKNLGWPLLQDRRKYLRLKLLYNIFIGATGLSEDSYMKAPSYVYSRLDHSLKVQGYQCRIMSLKTHFYPKQCMTGINCQKRLS